MVFGRVTGRDPRSLGGNECSGMELGLSSAHRPRWREPLPGELTGARHNLPREASFRG